MSLKLLGKLLFTLCILPIGPFAHGEEAVSLKSDPEGPVRIKKVTEIRDDGRKYYSVKDSNISLPELVFDEESGLFLIKISQNHIATIGSVKEIKKFRTPGKLIENSCNNKYKNIPCDLYTEYIAKARRVIWYKHPDKNKIGRVVKAYTSSQSYENGMSKETKYPSYLIQELDRYTPVARFSTQTDKPKFAIAELSQLKDSYLRCESIEWFTDLANQQKYGTHRVQVREWTAEGMFENPETKVSENRTFMSAYGVGLTLSQDKIAIDSIKMFPIVDDISTLFFGNNIFLGEVLGWNIQTDNRRCELSFNIAFVDIAGYLANLNEYLDSKRFTAEKFASSEEAQVFINKLQPSNGSNSKNYVIPKILQNYIKLGFFTYISEMPYNLQPQTINAEGVTAQPPIYVKYLEFSLKGVEL